MNAITLKAIGGKAWIKPLTLLHRSPQKPLWVTILLSEALSELTGSSVHLSAICQSVISSSTSQGRCPGWYLHQVHLWKAEATQSLSKGGEI